MSERQAKVQALHDVLKSELGEVVASKFTAADVGVLVDAGFNDAQDLRDAVKADELQQLQGLPGARRANLKAHYQGARPEGGADVSAVLATQLVGGLPEGRPPQPVAVSVFLARPLACPLPVTQQLYLHLRTIPECYSIMQHLQVQPAADVLTVDVSYALRHVSADGSESNHITGLDVLIKNWLRALSNLTGQLPHRSDRDKADQSTATQSSLRPDMCLWVDDMLIFKGEEKPTEEQLAVAVQELSGKMGNWSVTMFGSMPYMPCYAAAGKHLQFYVVPKNAQVAQAVSPRYDLTKVQDRVQVLITMVNMFQLLKLLAQCLPAVRIPVGQVLHRSDCTITITADYVVKVVRPFPSLKTSKDIAPIRAAYRAASASHHLVRARPGYPRHRQPTHTYTVQLTPVASHRTPLDESTLRLAITCVLRALSALHIVPLVHRDVRWQNIMWASDEVAILTDLESVAAVGSAADGFTSQAWTGSTLVNGAYTITSDLQLVGRLIEQCAGIASVQALDFAGKLEIHSYSTAEEALAHPWFSAT